MCTTLFLNTDNIYIRERERVKKKIIKFYLINKNLKKNKNHVLMKNNVFPQV